MKRHKIYLALILVLSILSLVACKANVKEENEGIKVYTTFYPLYDFTNKIGGNRIELINMIPAGVEPHDFEPSPKQIANLNDADVFIYLGEPMDPWANKVAKGLKDKGIGVLEAGENLIINNDPHIWLNPQLSKEISKGILEILQDIDEENKLYYEENYKKLEERFDLLDEKYWEALKTIKRKDLVVAHAAFGYLTERYGLNQIPITGLSPQEEPSPKKMADLSILVKEKDIKYIFFEALGSKKFSETLAKEVGAELLVINPLGQMTKEELEAGEDYFSIMEKNLDNILKALE